MTADSRVGQLPRDDLALIEACRQGERGALEQVLREQSPALERLLYRLVGPGADLEDLLQQTLIAAVSAFPRFRGEASVKTWIARIAVNVVRQHLRRPIRKRRVLLAVVPDEADQRPSADTQTDCRNQLERVYAHLSSIGDRKRIAFVLHVFEGRPLEEVAALMGATKSATKSRVFWARKELLKKAKRDPMLRELVSEEGRHE